MQEYHHLDVSVKAAYATLNKINPSTKHIWIACHGYGQLASHFIRRFDVLDANEHFVVAPQGLSRFYLKGHKEVGASWMTKEDRETDLINQKRYFDALVDQVLGQVDVSNYTLHAFGFSQGGPAICRFLAHARWPFDTLTLWGADFPAELTSDDFDWIKPTARLTMVLGDKDNFFQMPAYQKEIEKAQNATGLKARFVSFEGKHEIQREVLRQLL